MKLNIIIIIIVFLAFSGINFVFAQKTGAIALVFLSPDKEIYFPGDSVFIHGQDNMNVTSITIGLEKNHNVMVSSEDSQVLKNGTFYANFTLPRDSDAKYWSLVSGPLHQDLYFKPVYLSPLGQFREGIAAKDVQCKQGLQFIMKNENDQPACVTSHTFEELITRGWGIIPLGGLPTYHSTSTFDMGIYPFSINVANTNFTLNYNISGNNKLIDANMYAQKTSLVLSMHTSSNGTLSVSIPRALLDSNLYPDTHFIVLVDKKEVSFTETVSLTARTIIIPFEYGVETMEIIAPQRI